MFSEYIVDERNREWAEYLEARIKVGNKTPYTEGECWVWTRALRSNGYGGFGKKGFPASEAHRLACFIVNPDLDLTGKVVAHFCHNPACVRPEHLLITTQAENVAMTVEERNHAHGSTHGGARLRESTVRRIRSLKGIYSLREVGRMFGISHVQVYRIWKGEHWKHTDCAPGVGK